VRETKEAWDVSRFEQAYDAVAVREFGHALDRSPDALRDAQRAYEAGRCRSLEAFAEVWFEYTQRT
jgi:hypothetical protein